MNKYSHGYIYGNKCNKTNELYIGSSCMPMNIRLTKHKRDLKGYMCINKYSNYRSSFEVLFNEDYEMFNIEDYSCNSKKELETREALWIDKYWDRIVNKRRPVKLAYSSLDDLPSSFT